MKRKAIVHVAAVCFLLGAACPIVHAGEATDDLVDMSNTGKTFDGSDGKRSGMDINFTSVPATEVPEPTPEPVDKDNE